RVEDDAAHDVPVPQPVARPPGREGEALTTLDEPLLYAHARAEAGEREQREDRDRADVRGEVYARLLDQQDDQREPCGAAEAVPGEEPALGDARRETGHEHEQRVGKEGSAGWTPAAHTQKQPDLAKCILI